MSVKKHNEQSSSILYHGFLQRVDEILRRLHQSCSSKSKSRSHFARSRIIKRGNQKTLAEEHIVERTVLKNPQTKSELISILAATPNSVLANWERGAIASVMSLPDTMVRDIMLPESQMIFLNKTDFLGPLMLDKLYKSATNTAARISIFPVIGENGQIIGLVNTEKLNKLQVQADVTVCDIMDTKIYYVRDDYELGRLIAVFLRTGVQFFVVVDSNRRTVGCISLTQFLTWLLGTLPEDDFDGDDDLRRVAKRILW